MASNEMFTQISEYARELTAEVMEYVDKEYIEPLQSKVAPWRYLGLNFAQADQAILDKLKEIYGHQENGPCNCDLCMAIARNLQRGG